MCRSTVHASRSSSVMAEFLDADGGLLGTIATPLQHVGTAGWIEVTASGAVPLGARQVRVRLRALLDAGSVPNAAFDDVSLTIQEQAGDGAGAHSARRLPCPGRGRHPDRRAPCLRQRHGVAHGGTSSGAGDHAGAGDDLRLHRRTTRAPEPLPSQGWRRSRLVTGPAGRVRPEARSGSPTRSGRVRLVPPDGRARWPHRSDRSCAARRSRRTRR